MVPTNPTQYLGSVLVVSCGDLDSLGDIIAGEFFDGYDSLLSVLNHDLTCSQRTEAFGRIKPQVVIHAAYLTRGSEEACRKANLEGTRTIIEACVKSGATALVYTSPASITHDNASDLSNGSLLTMAEVETLVLAANRSPSLLTISLHPVGIFGQGDVPVISPMMVANANCLAACALMSTSKLATVPLENERVDGEAFIVTNVVPSNETWDYAKAA